MRATARNFFRARGTAREIFRAKVLLATARRKKRTRKPRLASHRPGIFWETSPLDSRIWRSFCSIKRRAVRACAECVGSFTGWRSSDELRERETRSRLRTHVQKLARLRALTPCGEDDRGRRDLGDASSNFPRLLDSRKLVQTSRWNDIRCEEPETTSALMCGFFHRPGDKVWIVCRCLVTIR